MRKLLYTLLGRVFVGSVLAGSPSTPDVTSVSASQGAFTVNWNATSSHYVLFHGEGVSGNLPNHSDVITGTQLTLSSVPGLQVFFIQGVSPIIFPDANLEAHILAAIPEKFAPVNVIYDIDVQPITSLDARPNASVNPLSDLTGITALVGLTELDVGQNLLDTTDMATIGLLTGLRILDLKLNQIISISALSPLTQLTHLDLESNLISDISALSGNTGLETLVLGGNSFSDTTQLTPFTQLKSLDLNNTGITSVPGLELLTQLEFVNLSNTPVADLQPLIDNTGFGTGDVVNVGNMPNLDLQQITQLQNKGVTVVP